MSPPQLRAKVIIGVIVSRRHIFGLVRRLLKRAPGRSRPWSQEGDPGAGGSEPLAKRFGAGSAAAAATAPPGQRRAPADARSG